MPAKPFLDSNVVLYLLSEDPAKADRAESLLNHGAVISVQVLNEVTNVLRRKLKMDWPEIREFLALLRSFVTVEPLSLDVHEQGLRLAERYGFSVYDAMIVAAARLAGSETLMSEDMQDGLVVEGKLRVCNPFSGV
jgi:predicted nucleic acid-binding protein